MAVYPPLMNRAGALLRRLDRPAASDPRKRERGQALVLFALLSLAMIGSVAIVTDISWLWYGNQRMQRAARRGRQGADELVRLAGGRH